MLKNAKLIPAALALIAAPVMAGPAEGQAAWEAGDYQAAVAEWRTAALAGNPDAQYGLGQAYLYGRGVPTDLAQAELWFRKASDQGHVEAADNLGLLLFQQGQRADALPLLTQSATRGEPRAQYVLGTAKFNGDLVERDWVGGYALMTRASAAGLPQASRALAQMDLAIPLADRQQGLVLAREMEANGPRVAARGADPLVRAPVVSAPAPTSPNAAPKPASVRATAAPAPASRAGAANGRWLIQVGAFRNRAGAEQRVKAVRASGPAMATLQPFLQAADGVTRVRLGPFTSRAAAEAACRSLRSGDQACFPVPR